MNQIYKINHYKKTKSVYMDMVQKQKPKHRNKKQPIYFDEKNIIKFGQTLK